MPGRGASWAVPRGGAGRVGAMALTLYVGSKRYSSWSLRPYLALAHAGLEYKTTTILLDQNDSKANIARVNPSGRVPVLHDGDLVVWDSLAICEYINDAYLDGGGWPRDLAARALARAVSAEMHSGFQALRNSLPLNCRRRTRDFAVPSEARRDIERIARIWRECRARAGAGDFLFGDFTIADAMYAPVVLRFRTYGIEL